MQATVAQIIDIMDRLVPPWLAEEWDNVGLQVGDPQLPVQRIWIALDPGAEVIEAACKNKVDLLITHHPLIFRPLKSIDFGTPGGSIIQMAARHQLAIFAAHTNFDIVSDGVNDILAKRLGLKNVEILRPIKVEARAQKEEGSSATAEELAYGIGRIGILDRPSSLKALISMVKKKLQLKFVKVAGDLKMKISRVALCSGSGSSLVPAFLTSEADVYISGDIHYHNARDAESVHRAIIDIGHFASEHLMVEALARRLEQRISDAGMSAQIKACTIEKDPFRFL
ncbi:MAG: Nif3-like dinuclear metal center hexameric protein [Deltaproteobacteria bacterium]|jgi:dinuclear metal center YbgI/SA1388 family protein|nr:Nif3-like dinuclear metal center hexameric protein [Deltaproteobacteria bacterium]